MASATRTFPAFLLTALLVFAMPGAMPGAAFAEDENAGVSTAMAKEDEPHKILAGETDIEKLTDDLAAARLELDAANERVAELQAQINEAEAALPAQQARSDAGMKQRYIMQSNPLVIIESLLSVDTLGDFLRQTEYWEIVSRTNLEELNRLIELKASLDAAHEEQERVRADASARVDEAGAVLRAKQSERDTAQARAQASAVRQASEQGGEKSIGVAYDGGKQPDDYKEAASTDTAALIDGADWYADRDAFIAEWAGRIDAYLKGSPLAGQGASFAAAAWKHGIDPRWSPAISNTESSKGAFCIRPHNAWGWGAADSDPYGLAFEWGSWEEAIDAHVAGLAEGYGYTISLENAKRYCPITWQSWYNHTLDQMKSI